MLCAGMIYYIANLKSSIDYQKNNINKYKITKSIVFDDCPHFKLCNDRCPHLNEHGLCNIILNCGEDYISDICREHPRFYNFTNLGKEMGIGMSCEEACRLILESDDFDQILELASYPGDIEQYEYDATQDRDYVFNILKNNSSCIFNNIKLLQDSFGINTNSLNYTDSIPNLEYLHTENKELLLKAKKIYWNESISAELSRILAYYVYRHCSEAFDYDEFRIDLSFAIYCTGLVSTLSDLDTIYDIARIVSEEIEYSQDNTETIKSLFE